MKKETECAVGKNSFAHIFCVQKPQYPDNSGIALSLYSKAALKIMARTIVRVTVRGGIIIMKFDIDKKFTASSEKTYTVSKCNH